MNAQTYIAEVETREGVKVFFVTADTRAKAVRKANSEALVDFEIVKPTKARMVPDRTVDDMLSEKKYDMRDMREKAQVVATKAMRRSLGALVGM